MGKGTIKEQLTYQEEDGWEFKRDDKVYYAYGTITASFINNWWYYPATMYRKNGDPGDPEDSGQEIELDSIIEFKCTSVMNADNVVSNIELTEGELSLFKEYMIEKVTDFAENDYDGWCYDD